MRCFAVLGGLGHAAVGCRIQSVRCFAVLGGLLLLLGDAEYNLRVVLLLWAGCRALIGCCGAKSPSAPPERSDGAPV